MSKRLLLITNSYPDHLSKEKSFVLPELAELARSGFRITIMPVHEVVELDSEFPNGVQVSNELARHYQRPPFLSTILALASNGSVFRELRGRPSLVFRFRFWKETLRAIISARLFERLRGKYDVFYTYWFAGETTGLRFANLHPVVSRAHGYDLYLERRENAGWIAYRQEDINHLSALILLSRQAVKYVHKAHAADLGKCIVSPLGVADALPCPPGDVSEEVLFFSCAFPSRVKRLPLIGKFVTAYAAANPHQMTRWVHIGAELSNLIPDGAPSDLRNLEILAKGPLPNSAVLEFLAKNEVTFFINFSEMEGLPVSIMEAMSFGIPAIATEVGCVSDLLEDGAGVLVPVDFSIRAVVAQVGTVLSDSRAFMQMRTLAQARQRGMFNSQRNHSKLAAYLGDLATNSPGRA